MNEYYHAFTIGFSGWMLVVPLAALVMALIGIFQYRMVGGVKNGKIRKVYNDIPYKYIDIFLTIIFGVLFVVGSWRGAMQYIDNQLGPNDSPVWTLIILPFVVVIGIAVFAFVMYYIGRIAALAKLGYLMERKRSAKYAVEDDDEEPEEEPDYDDGNFRKVVNINEFPRE